MRKRDKRKKQTIVNQEHILQELNPLIVRFTSGAILSRDDIKDILRSIGRPASDGAVENALTVLSKVLPIYDYDYAKYKLLRKEDL